MRSLSVAILGAPFLEGAAIVDDGAERKSIHFGEWIEGPSASNEGKHVDARISVQPSLANEALKVASTLGQTAARYVSWHVEIDPLARHRRRQGPECSLTLRGVAEPGEHQERFGRRLGRQHRPGDCGRASRAAEGRGEYGEANSPGDHVTTIPPGLSGCREFA